MFSGFRRHVARWRRAGTGPPPTLPVLALSVLAATRMHRDGQGASSAYYLRLAQALLPGASDEQVQRLKSLLPGAFQRDIARMWRELDEWLRAENGRFGRSTIREHPHFTLIGYPLSQALVRASDKAVLTRFFAAIDITGCGVPSRDSLMNYLRLWASRPRGLSESLRRALPDPDLSSLVAPTVEGLARAWDGRVVTRDGRARLDLRLVLDLDEWKPSWVIPLVEGVGPDVLTAPGACSSGVVLTPPDYGPYFAITGAPAPSKAAVMDGLRLVGKHASAEFPASRIVSFREDAHAGGWSSRESIEPYAEHILAVHPDVAGQVKSALEAAADHGWRLLRQPADAPLLPGFELFRRVRFSDEGKLDIALRPLQDYVKTALRPMVTARPRLGGGLPLVRGVASGCYLMGGAPDLYLPVGAEPRRVVANFDGYEQTFKATGFPLPLALLADVEPGEHVIRAEGEALRFRLLEGSPADSAPNGTGALAWDNQTGALTMRDGIGGVCGAYLGEGPWDEDPETEPLLVRRGALEDWWMHRNGTCSALHLPGPSPLANGELGVASQYAEVTPPGTAVWLLQRRQRGWAPPALVRRRGPEFTRLTAEARATMQKVFGPSGPVASADTAGLWTLYKRAWEQKRDR